MRTSNMQCPAAFRNGRSQGVRMPREFRFDKITLIGAHALSLGATLVTDNTREFSRIAPEVRHPQPKQAKLAGFVWIAIGVVYFVLRKHWQSERTH